MALGRSVREIHDALGPAVIPECVVEAETALLVARADELFKDFDTDHSGELDLRFVLRLVAALFLFFEFSGPLMFPHFLRWRIEPAISFSPFLVY